MNKKLIPEWKMAVLVALLFLLMIALPVLFASQGG